MNEFYPDSPGVITGAIFDVIFFNKLGYQDPDFTKI